MTDPRVGEIEAIEAAAWTIYKAMHPDHAATGLDEVGGPIRAYCIDIATAALEAAHPYLLAELRKAHEALLVHESFRDLIMALAEKWEVEFPSKAAEVRAAVAAANGDGRG